MELIILTGQNYPTKKGFLYTTIVLLTLLLSAKTIYYIVFDLAQANCKLQSQRSISSRNKLHGLTVPLKTFTQRADDKEMWIGGALYDIGGYQVQGDSVRLMVYHDNDEQELVANIAALFEVSGKQYYDFTGHHIGKVHSNGFNDCKVLPGGYELSRVTGQQAANKLTGYLNVNVGTIYAAILIPPPKGVVA